ncbi:MAG TPA: hypothetical protein VEI45_07245 [Mycobacterium sp.]|uniref:hypothetical protein n=1 Tax=Mycobacterium sp. TaxID=1785 RepID=UPI002D42090C|nr:hypothetical protein [Mycobacterium sp.]HXY64133.1 hypothetical protein [Mycobacterium sp.]
MSAQWVAGNVRARALLNRRLGVGRARALAAMNSLTDAQHALAATAYGRDITVGQPAHDTDHAVCAALLWHLRVLAGWQPPVGARAIRALAAGFEAQNIAAHARKLAGAPPGPPYTLGALASAWPRLSETRSLAQLRDILAQTIWGDPGSESPSDIALAVQVGWALRVANAVPEARDWADAWLALSVARRRLLELRELPGPVLVRARLGLGAAVAASDLASFTDAIATRLRWVFDGTTGAGGLWTAEARWWARVEADGLTMLGRSEFTRAQTIGAVAVLAADAWRCRAALALASRGGGPMDVYDVVA